MARPKVAQPAVGRQVKSGIGIADLRNTKQGKPLNKPTAVLKRGKK